MDKQNVIKFTDLHDKMVQSKTKLITKIDFKKWLDSNIKVERYLPIVRKYAIISLFLDSYKQEFEHTNEEDISTLFLEYDLNIMFKLLFKYTNVVVPDNQIDFTNYDLIIESGFYDYILRECRKDYEELLKKCNRVTGIDNMALSSQFVSLLENNTPKVEEMKKIKDIINNDIDKDKLQKIYEIETFNNQTMKNIVDGIEKESVTQIINQGK